MGSYLSTYITSRVIGDPYSQRVAEAARRRARAERWSKMKLLPLIDERGESKEFLLVVPPRDAEGDHTVHLVDAGMIDSITQKEES